MLFTYINGHYNPSVSITAQLLTALMLCALNFIRERRNLQFTGDSERQMFEKLFQGRFGEKINFSYFVLMPNLEYEPGLFTSNKPTHNLIDCCMVIAEEINFHNSLCSRSKNMGGDTYSLKSPPNDRFLRSFFKTILFTPHSFCQKSAERKATKKYFLHIFVLMSDLGSEPRPFV